MKLKNLEVDHESLCLHCETFIIDGPSYSSNGWMCEGSFCERAAESYLDHQLDEIAANHRFLKSKKKRIRNKWKKKLNKIQLIVN